MQHRGLGKAPLKKCRLRKPGAVSQAEGGGRVTHSGSSMTLGQGEASTGWLQPQKQLAAM